MAEAESAALSQVANECVGLVAKQFGASLDWSLDGLTALDAVCSDLLAEGPLTGQRLDLWWKLVGAYTGEVVVRAYGGSWVKHEQAPGAFAINALGITGSPSVWRTGS